MESSVQDNPAAPSPCQYQRGWSVCSYIGTLLNSLLGYYNNTHFAKPFMSRRLVSSRAVSTSSHGQAEVVLGLTPLGVRKEIRQSYLGPNSQRHSISDRSINTGALLIAHPIYGYLLGLKSIKTFMVGLQKL
jgi:hypothetical protein